MLYTTVYITCIFQHIVAALPFSKPAESSLHKSAALSTGALRSNTLQAEQHERRECGAADGGQDSDKTASQRPRTGRVT